MELGALTLEVPGARPSPRVDGFLFLVVEDETMNGIERNNVAQRRCVPFGFVPRRAVALSSSAMSMPLST